MLNRKLTEVEIQNDILYNRSNKRESSNDHDLNNQIILLYQANTTLKKSLNDINHNYNILFNDKSLLNKKCRQLELENMTLKCNLDAKTQDISDKDKSYANNIKLKDEIIQVKDLEIKKYIENNAENLIIQSKLKNEITILENSASLKNEELNCLKSQNIKLLNQLEEQKVDCEFKNNELVCKLLENESKLGNAIQSNSNLFSKYEDILAKFEEKREKFEEIIIIKNNLEQVFYFFQLLYILE